MKNWNAPEIKELCLSGTQQHGTPNPYVDGKIYDAQRNENWFTFSGNNVDDTATPGEVIIGNP
ncbi:hypothetical protein [Butyrivibrio proteoclasticus]|uniref:hypothetical protein n=1 Tax=Butyrivibrio proteoclasticus TaxID=43305 RepID=UPI0003064F49|nr:hypothetical protein [Butyrivibrio proteoclasticus]